MVGVVREVQQDRRDVPGRGEQPHALRDRHPCLGGAPLERRGPPSMRSDQPRSSTPAPPRCRSTDSGEQPLGGCRAPCRSSAATMPCSHRVRAVPSLSPSSVKSSWLRPASSLAPSSRPCCHTGNERLYSAWAEHVPVAIPFRRGKRADLGAHGLPTEQVALPVGHTAQGGEDGRMGPDGRRRGRAAAARASSTARPSGSGPPHLPVAPDRCRDAGSQDGVVPGDPVHVHPDVAVPGEHALAGVQPHAGHAPASAPGQACAARQRCTATAILTASTGEGKSRRTSRPRWTPRRHGARPARAARWRGGRAAGGRSRPRGRPAAASTPRCPSCRR